MLLGVVVVELTYEQTPEGRMALANALETRVSMMLPMLSIELTHSLTLTHMHSVPGRSLRMDHSTTCLWPSLLHCERK